MSTRKKVHVSMLKGSANAPSSGKKPKMAREGAYVPTGKPRGRPPKKGSVKRGPYVPTGKARGCPPGGWPEKPKIAKKGAYVPTGKPRGCPPGGWPSKNKVVENGGELLVKQVELCRLLVLYFMHRFRP